MANDFPTEPRIYEEFLTDEEREVLDDIGRLWNRLLSVVANGRTREWDLGELVVHVHAIQQAVMSNAAGRAYPGEYRLLGEGLDGPG